MSEFSVGEVAILVFCNNPDAAHLLYEECEIVGPLGSEEVGKYPVRFFGEAKRWNAKPSSLKKKPPPAYDGNQTTTWDTVPWVPKELVRA